MNPAGAAEARDMFRRSLPLLLVSFEDEQILRRTEADRPHGRRRPCLRGAEGDPRALSARTPRAWRQRRCSGCAAPAGCGSTIADECGHDDDHTDRCQPDQPVDLEDSGRLPVVPEAADRRDEEPGSDEADGFHEYVAQLATFSQVEQSVQTNTKLDQIMQSSALSQADAADRPLDNLRRRQDHRHGGIGALASSGLIAVLQNGTEVAVGPGVSVKRAMTSTKSGNRFWEIRCSSKP